MKLERSTRQVNGVACNVKDDIRNLICRGSPEGATSCRLLVSHFCHFVNVTCTTRFDLIRSSLGRYFT
jgi:hypothetical protein